MAINQKLLFNFFNQVNFEEKISLAQLRIQTKYFAIKCYIEPHELKVILP